MDNTEPEYDQAESNPAKAISQLSQSLAQTAEGHRVLIQEMTLFAKDEGLRFVNLRLQRNSQALDKLQNCHGVPGLIRVQQEWVRDLMQDYVDQNLRLADALRSLTQDMMDSVGEQADEIMEPVPHCESEIAQQAGQHTNIMAHDVNDIVQPTQ